MLPIGKITHYYDRLGVAIVELQDSVSIGDRIKIEKDDDAFEQTVSSIHKEHRSANNAVKGDVIGLKVDRPAKEGSLVLRLD